MDDKPDMVNHPPHYIRGPLVSLHHKPITYIYNNASIPCRVIECIEIIRHIKDFRLATAMKYIWRVAFGGKENDEQDIRKAIWYLNDWLEHKV